MTCCKKLKIVLLTCFQVQYIRVQLAGTDYLSLAEVEVWGYPEIQVRKRVG